jgi:hypothetical protein
MARALAIAFLAGLASLHCNAQDYEDKLIEGGKLEPLAAEGGDTTYNSEGPARSWRIEGYASRIEQGDTIRHENGMVLAGRLDTLQYGALSIDATLRGAGTASVVTLWQRGLAFDNGWVANNGLGTLNTPAIDLTRNQFRFYLPTFPVLGASTEWIRHGGDLVVQASAGQPGLYDGIRVAGFSRLGGSLSTLGAQLRVDRNLSIGVQLADANNVPASVDPSLPSPKVSGRSVFAALQWHDAASQLQLNALDSETSDTGRHNFGIWADGEMRDGRFHHNYGLFRFEPDLSWAYTPVNRDLQGGYYRLSYSSQQWNWSAGVDGVAPVTDAPGTRGWFSTGNIRYQADTTTGVGGGSTLRTGQGPSAFAGYAFLDKQTMLGTTRVQVDVVSASGQEHSRQLTVDQAWPTQVGLRLSTSLQAGEQKTTDTDVRRFSVAAFGGIDLTNNLSIEGNIRYSLDRDTARTTGLFANLGLAWKITQRWSLLATYYDNRSEVTPFATLEPVVVQPLPVVPRDRAFFLNVRYEDHAGTPVAPLGGMPGTGAGSLTGYVFYDANDNGRRDATEQGAANLTVILDGRFGARTDKDGRFEFPLLASGSHAIAIIPDNLALPYSISGEGRREVIIHTRETTTLDVAAVKPR